MNMVRGSHILVTMQNMPSAVHGELPGTRASKFSFLAPGCVQILPTDLCAGKRPQIMQSRALQNARITTRTRTRTDRQTNQEYHFLGEGKKQSRKKPRKTRWKERETSLCSPVAGSFLSFKVKTS